MKTTPAAYFYPNRMGRIMLMAMEEIVGLSGSGAILNLSSLSYLIGHYPPKDDELAFSFETIARLHAVFEDLYGPRAGRGVALRIGRASFQYGLREFGPRFGLTDVAFRMLPLRTKLKAGAKAFAEIFNTYSDQQVQLNDDGQMLYWHIKRCPLCWGRQSTTPSCHMAVGLLEEALYWVSGGKFFIVEETQCVACGDEDCTIAINKTPVN